MVHFLAATDSVETSERLCEYLSGRVGADDTVSALNSLRGGDDTDDDDIRVGEEAVEYVADALDCAVETRQLVRGNAPATDVFEFAEENDVDEIVIGIHKRNPTGKVIFGSTAQDILLESEWPIVAVPAHW